MTRSAVLVLGLIAWALAAVVAISHLLAGDAVVPAAMVLAAAGWLLVRGYRQAERVAVEA